MDNVTVRNCRVDGTNDALDKTKLRSGILFTGGSGHQAYDNIVWNWENGEGIYVKIGGTNCKIWNNTVFNNQNGIVLLTGTGNEIKNNIAWGNTSRQIMDETGADMSNNLTSDPDFISTNPNSDNFLKISPSSPAIDAGVTISAFNTDIEGTIRPQGSAWDIGAYEYGSEMPVK